MLLVHYLLFDVWTYCCTIFFVSTFEIWSNYMTKKNYVVCLGISSTCPFLCNSFVFDQACLLTSMYVLSLTFEVLSILFIFPSEFSIYSCVALCLLYSATRYFSTHQYILMWKDQLLFLFLRNFFVSLREKNFYLYS